jgi:hypothetical protein
VQAHAAQRRLATDHGHVRSVWGAVRRAAPLSVAASEQWPGQGMADGLCTDMRLSPLLKRVTRVDPCMHSAGPGDHRTSPDSALPERGTVGRGHHSGAGMPREPPVVMMERCRTLHKRCEGVREL